MAKHFDRVYEWELIGKGGQGRVYAHPDGQQVVKVFERESDFRDELEGYHITGPEFRLDILEKEEEQKMLCVTRADFSLDKLCSAS